MFGCGISDDPSFEAFLSDLVLAPVTTAYKIAGEPVLLCSIFLSSFLLPLHISYFIVSYRTVLYCIVLLALPQRHSSTSLLLVY